jgi:hypothetical protein
MVRMRLCLYIIIYYYDRFSFQKLPQMYFILSWLYLIVEDMKEAEHVANYIVNGMYAYMNIHFN